MREDRVVADLAVLNEVARVADDLLESLERAGVPDEDELVSLVAGSAAPLCSSSPRLVHSTSESRLRRKRGRRVGAADAPARRHSVRLLAGGAVGLSRRMTDRARIMRPLAAVAGPEVRVCQGDRRRSNAE